MELVDLMKKISNNDIPHFLILYGKEQTILDIYIKNIIKSINAKQIHTESVTGVIKNVGMKSLDKSIKVYTVIDDQGFIKSDDKWLSIQKSMNKDYLILRYHSLDKRSAFVKKHQQNIVEFSHLSPNVLEQYIRRDLPELNDKNINKLIEYCSHDYGRILMEIDKIKQHIEYNTDRDGYIPEVNGTFKVLDNQGLFHKDVGDITFDLTNAILGGYPETAVEKLYEAKRKGEPAMMIASILYNGFRNLLAYQGLGSDKQGALERTGMSKGELWGCSKNIGGYSLEEVRRDMLFCQKVEAGIKMGTIDEDIALEYLVLHCLQ